MEKLLKSILLKTVTSTIWIFWWSFDLYACGATWRLACYQKFTFIIKLDLSKAYNQVSWDSLGLLLIYISFSFPMVNWIEEYYMSTSYEMLVNKVVAVLFKPSKGLGQGWLVSLLMFLLMNKGLNCGLSILTLHSRKRSPSFIIKFDQSKAYYWVSWDHLGLVVIHIIFILLVEKWIEECYMSTSYATLVNKVHTSLLKPFTGLKQ